MILKFTLKTQFFAGFMVKIAQGQLLGDVGVNLPQPVFSHGQLYVGMSRSQSFNGLKVFSFQGSLVNNIVYRDVLA